MARKIYKRQYPQSVRFLRPVEVRFVNFAESHVDIDTSVGYSSSKRWITDNSENGQARFDYERFIRPQELSFVTLLLAEDFSDSVRNDATLFFNGIVRRHREAALLWILDLYNQRQDDEVFLMQLLRLLRCFPYEYLKPASMTLATNAVHHVSDYVKSEALSLLDHWGNRDVLRIMQNHEAPNTPWLRMKYYAIRETLEKYVTLQEN